MRTPLLTAGRPFVALLLGVLDQCVCSVQQLVAYRELVRTPTQGARLPADESPFVAGEPRQGHIGIPCRQQDASGITDVDPGHIPGVIVNCDLLTMPDERDKCRIPV